MSAPAWFTDHLGWKKATAKASKRCLKWFDVPLGPNLADLSGTSSTRIAGEVYRILGIPTNRVNNMDLGTIEAGKEKSDDDQVAASDARLTAAGTRLEVALARDIADSLEKLDPSRGWKVTRQGGVQQFAQYEHLRRLQALFESDLTLKSTLGRDYHVSTDVMVGVPTNWERGPKYTLHAAVSSKLTIRSDRVQNIRFEFGTLVKNRKGRLPHLVVVTAEPLPSRLVSIGRGTGEIDAVYHLLFDEMDEALRNLRGTDRHLARQEADWAELVETSRIRPYHELARVLSFS